MRVLNEKSAGGVVCESKSDTELADFAAAFRHSIGALNRISSEFERVSFVSVVDLRSICALGDQQTGSRLKRAFDLLDWQFQPEEL